MHNPQRRFFLSTLGAATTLLAASPLARAAAPFASKPVTGVHRMKLGHFEVTSLLDGYVDIDTKLLNADAHMVAELLHADHLPDGPVRTAVTAFLINTGDKLVLIDCGTAGAFGPTLGRLPESLALAGVEPAQVDEVLITHLHPDHFGGALNPDGSAFFPQATIRLAQADHDFWTSDAMAAKAPKEVQPFFALAKKVLGAYGERVKPFVPDIEIVPGIRAVAAVGHTPGHSCYAVESEGKKLLAVGDILHVAAVQFPRVDVTIGFDSDAKQALATRKRFFDQAAKEQFLIAATHLPFPGVGYVRKTAKAYAFDPLPWQLGV